MNKLLKYSSIALVSLSFISNSVMANTDETMQNIALQQPLNLNTLKQDIYTPPPNIQINAASWILLDYQTGEILSAHNIHAQRKPASLVKIMTAYIVAKALANKSINWNEEVPITEKAWRTGGSKMFVKPGQKVTVENLMQGMIIQSGNDATVALAQFLAGSEAAFVELMNYTAKQLGMKNTVFMNASGLPSAKQTTSAYDIALLARAFIHSYPKVYKLYSQQTFKWNNIIQKNRNTLLGSNSYVDGMKTGYTKEAGYNLVTSAIKNNQRVISVVLGAPNIKTRTEDSNKLITYGFRFFTTKKIYNKGDIVKKVPINNTEQLNQQISLHLTKPIVVTIPKGSLKYIKSLIQLKGELSAPIKQGQVLGVFSLSLDGQIIASSPVASGETFNEAGYFKKITNKIRSWF